MKTRTAVACCLSMLVYCSAFTQAPLMFQGNPGRTGVTARGSIRFLKGFAFAFKTAGPVRSTPAVKSGIVCFGSGDGNVYAIDSRDGTERWRFATRGPVNSSPAIENETVYVGSRDGSLYALNLKNGAQQWVFRFGKDLKYLPGYDYYGSSPVVDGGILFVGSGDGHVYALNAGTGALVWKTSLGARVRTSPALTNALVLVGTMDGHIVAMSRGNGSIVWNYAIQGAGLRFEDFGYDRTAVVSSPSTDGKMVVAGGRDGFVYALSVDDGTLLWKFDHNISWAISTMGHKDNAVFGGSSDGRFLNAIDKESGREIWRYTTGGPVWASPCFSDAEVYCGDYAGNLFALDVKTGDQLWTFDLGDRIHGSPVISDGRIYVGCDNGYLYSIEGVKTQQERHSETTKAVFWEKSEGFNWFSNRTDEFVRDYFVNEGYEVADAERLRAVMEAQIDGSRRSVVVFAVNRVPEEFLNEDSGPGLFRRYLNAHGKAIWLGACPPAYRRDVNGNLIALDFSVGARVVGINYPGNSLDRLGLYGSKPTDDGIRWGLRDWWVGFGAVDPAEVTTVLSVDETGLASCWVKNYGGPEGTGLVQLWIPRDRPVDLTFVKQAAEFGMIP